MSDQITIRLNGSDRHIRDQATIGELLRELGMDRDGIAVAVDHQVIPRSRHDEVVLADGAAVEVIRAVGGG